MKQRAGADRRRHRPAGQRRRDATSRSTATAPSRLGIDLARRSTTRSTTPSASARSRPSTSELNQYHVVMEWAPRYTAAPERAERRLRAGARPERAARRRRRPRHRRRGHRRVGRRERRGAVGQPRAARPVHRQRAEPTRATPLVPLSRSRASASARRRPSINHQDAELATTISFNLADGKTLADAARGDQAGRGRHRHADQRARQLPGHGARRAAVAGAAAVADPRGARRDLHRAGHALREPGASDHRAVHAALGRRRRGARAAACSGWSSRSSR